MRARVLFVVNNPDVARSVTAMLEMQAYAVARARDEDHAAEQLEREHFDVLIVDVKVTDPRAGLRFLRHLNTTAQHLLPRTIVISVEPPDHIRRELEAIGICDIVLKPIHATEVLAAVEECMDRMSTQVH